MKNYFACLLTYFNIFSPKAMATYAMAAIARHGHNGGVERFSLSLWLSLWLAVSTAMESLAVSATDDAATARGR